MSSFGMSGNEIGASAEVPSTTEAIYNVPDGFESDPEVIRAELLFYNTPTLEAYSEDVYKSLLNIQEQCEVDYQKYCSTVKTQYIDISDLLMPSFSMFLMGDFNRRRLATTDKSASSGKEFLDHFRSYYMPNVVVGSKVTEDLKKELASVAAPAAAAATEEAHSATSRLVAQQTDSRSTVENMLKPGSVHSTLVLNGKLSNNPKRFADGHLMPRTRMLNANNKRRFLLGRNTEDIGKLGFGRTDRPPNPPPPPPQRPPAGPDDRPRNPPKDPARDRDHDHHDKDHHDKDHHDKDHDHHGHRGHDSGSDSETDGDSRSDREGEFVGENAEEGDYNGNPWEDHSFPGALGFGAQGDLCMYDNAQNLSPSCLNAVGQLHALRADYWDNYSSSSYHHHHAPLLHLVFLFFAALGFVGLVKRIVHRKKIRAVHALVNGLNQDPELKNAVEARLNLKVPELCRKGQCPGQNHSCCARICYFVGFFFVSLILSFVITVSSLEMTSAIVTHMDENNQDSTTPGTAMVILFLLCSVQVIAVTFAIHKLKKCYNASYEPTVHEPVTFNPSAPPSAPSSNNNNNGGQRNTAIQGPRLRLMQFQSWINPRITAVSHAIRSASRRVGTSSDPVNGAYVPLMGDETEMIAVGSVHGGHNGVSSHGYHPVGIYTGVPVNPNQTTMVPIQATPVTAVHFV
jgi:hypothetical protein